MTAPIRSIPMPPPDAQPRSLRVETANFLIRTLEENDATESWCQWLMDSRAQRMLNAKAQRLTLDQVQGYIRTFNRVTSHLLGIFEKETGRLVGMRAVYIDPVRKEYSVNVLIGEADARGKGARHETRFAMHNFMFEELGMEAARATVMADNEEMIGVLSRNGWILEHTDVNPRAGASGVVQRNHYRLTRDVWRATQAEKALSDQAAKT